MWRSPDAGTRDLLAFQKISEGFIEGRKIVGVAQADAHVDDVGKGRTRGYEDALKIGQRLAGLLPNVGRDDLARLRVKRALARHEQHVAEADALGEWRGDGLAGETRRRGRSGRDDLLGHLMCLRAYGLGMIWPHPLQVRALSESKKFA